MRTKNYKWIIGILLTILLTGCNKYLDLQPKGVKIMTTTDDYDLWLNNVSLSASIPTVLDLLADNIDNPTISVPVSGVNDYIYTWQPQFSTDVTASPALWTQFYANIYYYNTVLQGIDNATGSEDERKSLKAEAYLGRAFSYLYLADLYADVYNQSSAAQDLCVPFVISNDIEDAVPPRSTVQEIYDHIIADIDSAMPHLPESNTKNRFRGSIGSAYSVLARTYLYMGDYIKAAENAQMALDKSTTQLLKYSSIANINGLPFTGYSNEAIYARLSTAPATRTTPSLAFLKTFNTKDQRLRLYYSNLGDYSFNKRGTTKYQPNAVINYGTSAAEMRLIIAEAAARDNNLTTALVQLDSVRKYRYADADYVKYTSNVQEDVLNKILAERTFEFAYNGLRWFDMRRLDAENRMPEVTRYDGQGNVIGTLTQHSNRYTLQIPMQVMYYHADWQQNPE